MSWRTCVIIRVPDIQSVVVRRPLVKLKTYTLFFNVEIVEEWFDTSVIFFVVKDQLLFTY